MFNTLPTPVVFAHRGASGHAPENTIAAFNLAVSQGAPAIEFDVRLTADKIPVIFHDSSVSRTTNGSGKIHKHSLEELKSLNAGAAFGSAYPDLKIPTLDEALSGLDSNTFYNIELKNNYSLFDDLPKIVARFILEHHAENHVLISSFNPVALSRIAKILPTVPRGLLLHKSSRVDLCLLFPHLISGFQSIHLSFSTVTRERVYAIHQFDKRVYTYTLNHPADIHHALNCGVDGFFTDDPPLALRIISDHSYNHD